MWPPGSYACQLHSQKLKRSALRKSLVGRRSARLAVEEQAARQEVKHAHQGAGLGQQARPGAGVTPAVAHCFRSDWTLCYPYGDRGAAVNLTALRRGV
jgi:hypothetical protein